MSSSSAAVNIYKNLESENLLLQYSNNEFNHRQEKQIQECMRSFNIELSHLLPLKSNFIKCDRDHTGFIQIQDLIKRLSKVRI